MKVIVCWGLSKNKNWSLLVGIPSWIFEDEMLQDPCSNKFFVSRNFIFFENQYLFSTSVESSYVSPPFHTFEDLSYSFEQLKQGFVYEWRKSTLSHPKSDSPLETTPQLESENSSRSNSHVPTWWCTRVSHTHNWMSMGLFN